MVSKIYIIFIISHFGYATANAFLLFNRTNKQQTFWINRQTAAMVLKPFNNLLCYFTIIFEFNGNCKERKSYKINPIILTLLLIKWKITRTVISMMFNFPSYFEHRKENASV